MVTISVRDEIHAKPALALIMPLREAICTFPCTRFAACFSVDYSPWPHCPVYSDPTGLKANHASLADGHVNLRDVAKDAPSRGYLLTF